MSLRADLSYLPLSDLLRAVTIASNLPDPGPLSTLQDLLGESARRLSILTGTCEELTTELDRCEPFDAYDLARSILARYADA